LKKQSILKEVLKRIVRAMVVRSLVETRCQTERVLVHNQKALRLGLERGLRQALLIKARHPKRWVMRKEKRSQRKVNGRHRAWIKRTAS